MGWHPLRRVPHQPGRAAGLAGVQPAWNLFAQIIIDDMLKELGPEAGVEIFWHVDGQLHRGARPSAAAVRTRQIVLLLADDIIVTSSFEEGLRLAAAALNRAARRWGMELSAEKSKVLVFRQQRRPAPSHAAAEASAAAVAAARAAFLDTHASGSRLMRAGATAREAGASAAADAAGAKATEIEKRRINARRKAEAAAVREAAETAAVSSPPAR